MKKYLVFAMLLGIGAIAVAATLNGSWTNATTNTDGTAIPASGPGSIASTELQYGPCNATATDLASVTGTVTATGSATTAVTPDLPPGNWCAKVRHVNTYGNASAWSNVGVKVIATPTPRAPTNFLFN